MIFYDDNFKLLLDSVEDFILTFIIEFSIKSYVYPEIFSSAQKNSLKRFFDSCDVGARDFYFGDFMQTLFTRFAFLHSSRKMHKITISALSRAYLFHFKVETW